MITILHGSDLQYGKPYRPAVGQAFRDLSWELEPDLVVVAGDLTQRARAEEFRAVRDFIDSLSGGPVLVVPGNHDVPLYRFWERLGDPYRNWRRFLERELDSTTTIEGATVVGLNSSAPHEAIVGGRLHPGQVEFARGVFEACPDDHVRILVVHHHFIPTPDAEGGNPLPGARALLRAFEDMGVDMILGGHVHQTHITSSRTIVPGEADDPGIALIACGTTASSRGRGAEAGLNSLNVIRITDDAVEVTPRRFDVGAGAFVQMEPHAFRRGVLRPEPAEPEGSRS